MAKYKEILDALKVLTTKLYGENGFEGDITEIKNHLKTLNGHLDDHSKRLVIVETKVEERTTSKISKKAMAGYGGGGSAIVFIIYGVGKLAGWW